jgi:hypothetical protein
MGDFDALVRRIDVVMPQHFDEGIARVRHWLHLGNHSKPKSGLSLIWLARRHTAPPDALQSEG